MDKLPACTKKTLRGIKGLGEPALGVLSCPTPGPCVGVVRAPFQRWAFGLASWATFHSAVIVALRVELVSWVMGRFVNYLVSNTPYLNSSCQSTPRASAEEQPRTWPGGQT